MWSFTFRRLTSPLLTHSLTHSRVLLFSLFHCSCLVASHAAPPPPTAWPGADLFTNGAVQRIQIVIANPELEKLRQDSRRFVRAKVTQGVSVFPDVGLHLKGSVGSFRPLDDKPALTLDFSRFKQGQKFYGLRRIHLNNSVEDPGYVNELLGGELFRAAGVPAPRVAHALVTLNGRELGLYILKEGFTEDFLACCFKTIGPDLFEPQEGHDIDQPMKHNSVQAPEKASGSLKPLADAALEPDAARRWQRLEEVLDLDRFISFMAMEVMLCHRDGYTLARNNFRVYHDLDTGKIVFFPHGMDQLFGRADLPWQPQMAGLVARAVMDTPEGRQRYQERFGLLVTNLFQPELLNARIDQVVSQLRPFLPGKEFAAIKAETDQVKSRVSQRRLNLQSQLTQPELRPLRFESGIARLQDWTSVDLPPRGQMDHVTCSDGVNALRIVANGNTSASWRAKALLDRGRYRFEGRLRVAGVKPLPYGQHQGAGLRVAGAVRQSDSLTGESGWQTLETEFAVETATQETELICELRASAGEAWFDLNSLQLLKLEP